MTNLILSTKSIVFAIGGAFLGFIIFNDYFGVIIGFIFGFILSLRLK
jgi:hypothetical protein